MGPTLGPFCAGFLSENQGWRWVMGLLSIFGGVMWILGAIFVPETYAPVILRKRVAKLGQMTGKVYILEADKERGPPSIKVLLPTALIRPWILLFKEPIVLLLSIYIALIYGKLSSISYSSERRLTISGTLYLLFGAYPIVFQKVRGWSEGVGGLPFLGVAGGMILGIGFAGWTNKWLHQRGCQKRRNRTSRSTLAASLLWRGRDPSRSVLVRLHQLHLDSLDLAGPGRRSLRIWIHRRVLGCHQLSRRLIHHFCGVGSGSKHSIAITLRRGLPSVHPGYVRCSWDSLGDFSARLCCIGLCPFSFHFLQVWSQHTRSMCICGPVRGCDGSAPSKSCATRYCQNIRSRRKGAQQAQHFRQRE